MVPAPGPPIRLKTTGLMQTMRWGSLKILKFENYQKVIKQLYRLVLQRTCVKCFLIIFFHLFLELSEGDDLFCPGDWTVVNDGRLFPAATLHVTIHGIVTHVQLPSHVPVKQVGWLYNNLEHCRL